MSELDSAIVEQVREAALSDRYAAYLRSTLVELASIDTSPKGEDARGRVQSLFDFVAGEVRTFWGEDVRIEQTSGESAQLVVQVPGEGDPAAIMQVNVDTASPWFTPRAMGERVLGRGVCRNKAQVAVLLAQMKLLAEVGGRTAMRGCVYRFVVKGGSGGEAGLPTLVLDCTDRMPCAGQHGLVRYRCRLSSPENLGFSAVELFPLVVLGLEKEGRKMGRETVAPGFVADRVKPNVGKLGRFGTSTVVACERVAIEIEVYARAKPERIAMIVTQLLDAAMVQYAEKYGDKTREIDPATGQPMLDRHFKVDLKTTAEASIVRIDVYGCTAHMASNAADSAIRKAAFLLGALLRMVPKYPNVRAIARLADDDASAREIMLEGAQSFALPLTTKDVEQRLMAAAVDGMKKYCQLRQCKFDPGMIELSFDSGSGKACTGSPDSVAMQSLRKAFGEINEPWSEPTAWVADSNPSPSLISRPRPLEGMGHPCDGGGDVIFGAGKLDAAYGPNEHVDIPDLQKTLAISTLAACVMADAND